MDALIENALNLNGGTKAFAMAEKLQSGAIKATDINIGELVQAYKAAGGDTTFMSEPNVQTQNGEILVPELPEI